MAQASASPFGRQSTLPLLRAACAKVNRIADGAELLRMGENAIYLLSDRETVVRIARNMDHWPDATKEVAVSRWLHAAGLAAARTCDVPQPINVDGHPTTFWRYVPGRRGASGDVAVLGRTLRQLHELPPPAGFQLPREEILARVAPRVERSAPATDREFLLRRLDEIRAELEKLEFVRPACVTHGDAHVQNLLIDNGQPTLIDLERVAIGQPEWDLAMTATEYVTAKWWTPEQYEGFSDAYGFNIMSWDGFDILRRVHEIKMTTWLMQNIRESVAIQKEYAIRIEAIRTGHADAPWTPF